jgi:serine/threonine protein phosphatase 1
MLWIRDKFLHSRHDFGKPVVFGHTPLGEPMVESNKIGIDTGAVFGNTLTCVQLPDMVFFSA